MRKSKSLLALMALLSAFGISEAVKADTHAGIEATQSDEHQYIVRFDGNGDVKALGTVVSNLLNREVDVIDSIDSELIQAGLIKMTSAEASVLNKAGLIATPNVVYSQPNAQATSEIITDPSSTGHANFTQETIDVDYTKAPSAGAGIKIGILDTGLYYDQISDDPNSQGYQAFRALPEDLISEYPTYYTADEVKAKTQANGFVGKSYQYINSKIIYTFDYAGPSGHNEANADTSDRDGNVQPIDGNEHGTHTASLAAGNGADYQGVAPNAQLAIFKVFGDSNGGASEFDITAALNDAYALGLDIVNLSLGSPLEDIPGYNTEKSTMYQLISDMQDNGTIVNFSAGNDGMRQQSVAYGDYISTDAVEAGVLGSYATLDPSNVVASSTLNHAYSQYLGIKGWKGQDGATNDQRLSFTDQVQNVNFKTLFENGNETVSYQVIGNTFENHGKADDYTEDANVSGKVAVCWRGGGVSFEVMARQAEAHGAIGLIVINNVNEQLSFSFGSYSPSIPVALLPMYNSDYFNASNFTGNLYMESVLEENSLAHTVSDFSSQGATLDLRMKPDITAPGTSVLGAVRGGYQEMSGTSMACPNLCGAMAVVLSEELREANQKDASTAEQELKTFKSEIMARAQSTSTLLQDTPLANSTSTQVDALRVRDKDGNLLSSDKQYVPSDSPSKAQRAPDYDYASPTLQGAGEIDVNEVLSADAWASVGGLQNGRYMDKIEFGTTDLSQEGAFDLPAVTIHNESDTAKSYSAYLYIGAPEASIPISSTVLSNMNEEFQEYYGEAYAGTYMRSQNTYLGSYIDLTTAIADDANHTSSQNYITVPANSTFDYDLGALDLTKVAPELIDYIEGFYKNGTNLQGYLVFVPSDHTEYTEDEEKTGNVEGQLSVPFLGFYGDYFGGDAAEPFDFQRDNSQIYGSDVVNVLSHSYVTYQNANADFGSHLYAVSGYEDDLDMMLDLVSSWVGQSVWTGVKLGYNKQVGTFSQGVVAGTDQLVIQQFMQRDAVNGNAYLKDSDGNIVSSCKLWCYPGQGTLESSELLGPDVLAASDYLTKSLFTSTYLSSYIFAPMTGGLLNLRDSAGQLLPEGDYTLDIEYTLAAGYDVDHPENAHKSSNTVNITIDRRTPEFEGITTDQYGSSILYTSTDTEYVEFVTDQIIYLHLYTDSEGDKNYGYFYDSYAKNGFIHAILHGANGNTSEVLIDVRGNNPVSISTSGASSFTGLYLDVNSEGSTTTYSLTAYGANGSSIYISDSATVTLNIGSGKTLSKVFYAQGNRQIETDDFDYDSETGLLTITLPRGVTQFGYTL